jgi:hypothetical protein
MKSKVNNYLMKLINQLTFRMIQIIITESFPMHNKTILMETLINNYKIIIKVIIIIIKQKIVQIIKVIIRVKKIVPNNNLKEKIHMMKIF